MTGGKESIILVKGGMTDDKASSRGTVLRPPGQQRLLEVITLGLNVENEVQWAPGEEHVTDLGEGFQESFLDSEGDDKRHRLEKTHT